VKIASAATALLMLVASASAASGGAPGRPDPWTNYDRGVGLAEAAIVKCLDMDARTPPDGSMRCVRTAYLTCERQHGTMSQHDMNDCSAF
jgi:hypothetical protein